MMTRKTVFALAIVTILITGTMLYAGPLNPPAGPIASTAKTLNEVEPRIAINSINTPGDADSVFRISQPGSYYLTGNVTGVAGKHGIAIASADVSIDLQGFTLIGGPGTRDGISTVVPGLITNITISNGTVSSWGFSGVNLVNFAPSHCKIHNLVAKGNASHGFILPGLSNIFECRAFGNSIGIQCGSGCNLIGSSASDNTSTGILVNDHCTLTRCIADDNLHDGISAGPHCVLEFCITAHNGYFGISTGDNSTAIACSSSNNSAGGILAGSGAALRDCESQRNGLVGIDARVGASLEHCTVLSNFGTGIVAHDSNALADCTVSLNDGTGIAALKECTIDSCNVIDNLYDGIFLRLRCAARNNHCYGNGRGTGDGSGIHATEGGNRIEGNSCARSDRGIDVDAPLNFVARNICEGNSTNWTVVAGNFCLVIQAAAGGAINGNTGGVPVGTSDPNANFTY